MHLFLYHPFPRILVRAEGPTYSGHTHLQTYCQTLRLGGLVTCRQEGPFLTALPRESEKGNIRRRQLYTVLFENDLLSKIFLYFLAVVP